LGSLGCIGGTHAARVALLPLHRTTRPHTEYLAQEDRYRFRDGLRGQIRTNPSAGRRLGGTSVDKLVAANQWVSDSLARPNPNRPI
jgi:hypothetical protein